MKIVLFVLLSALITSCSDDKSATVDDKGLAEMVGSQIKAMQKANDVKKVLSDADMKRREKIGQ